jgi:glycosyltransferase involved in cell wall biosynthesis
MKKVVMLSGVVYPNASPPGKIALEYADMIKDRFDVSIVFMQTSLSSTNGKSINGIKYYSVFGLRLFIETFFFNKAEKSIYGPLKKIFRILVLLMKMIGRLESMLIFPNNLRWHYKKAYKKLIQLNKEEKIDCIFSLCSPFSAHLAAKDFKKKFPEVHWVTYTVDPFATSERLNDIALFSIYKNKNNLVVERQVYQEADINLVSEEIYETEKVLLKDLEDKTIPLPYTLKRPVGNNKEYFPKNKINLLYAGRFYKDLRNPENFLNSFLRIKNENILLHLYSASNCEDLVDEMIEKSNGRIIKHPQVSVVEINNILLDADILVNIGNSIGEFKPSKVFEYIATGKPVINFYRNGLIDETFSHFPLAIQINEDTMSLKESSGLVETFSLTNKNKTVEWNEIEKIYKKHSYSNIQNIILSSIILKDLSKLKKNN